MGFVELSVLDSILIAICAQMYILIHVLYPKVYCMIDACLMIVRNVYVHIMSFVIILLGGDFSIYVGHE